MSRRDRGLPARNGRLLRPPGHHYGRPPSPPRRASLPRRRAAPAVETRGFPARLPASTGTGIPPPARHDGFLAAARHVRGRGHDRCVTAMRRQGGSPRPRPRPRRARPRPWSRPPRPCCRERRCPATETAEGPPASLLVVPPSDLPFESSEGRVRFARIEDREIVRSCAARRSPLLSDCGLVKVA